MRSHIATAWLTAGWLFVGMLVEWHAAEDRAAERIKARVAKARAIGDGNMLTAETMLRACFHHAIFFVDEDIYRCRAVKIELKTTDFPELSRFHSPTYRRVQ